jgi:hypothetical protein
MQEEEEEEEKLEFAVKKPPIQNLIQISSTVVWL